MKIHLSPMDYYFFRHSLYTIQFVFEYSGHLEISQFEQNVSTAIQSFDAVGSRLKIISDTEIIFETGFPISIRSQNLNPEPPLSQPLDVEALIDSVTNGEQEPLFKILVSYSASRTFVGFSFSHMLGDGMSFFQFLEHLSQICTSQPSMAKASNQRDLLQIDSLDISSDQTMIGSLFDETGYIMPRPANPSAFRLESFSYSRQQLIDLQKSYANQSIRVASSAIRMADQGLRVSSNDILMAELAKRFHRSIPLYENKLIVRCPVDYRKILGLPDGYFGNAVRDAIAVFQPNEIENLQVPEIALRIRQSIQSIDKNSILRSLRCLDTLRKKNGISIFEDLGCPGLLVSNLSKFPTAQIDLGIGPPTGLHHASLNPRLGLILPTQNGVQVHFKCPIEPADEFALTPSR